MGAGITVDVNTRALQEGFNSLLKRGQNLQPLMFDIGEYLVAETDDRFDEERAPDGTAWEQSRRAKEEGGKTLTKSTKLRKSITHIDSKNSVLYGAKGDYVAIHQFGGTIKAKGGGHLKFGFGSGDSKGFASVKQVTIPARPFLGVTPDDMDEIKQMTADYLTESLK